MVNNTKEQQVTRAKPFTILSLAKSWRLAKRISRAIGDLILISGKLLSRRWKPLRKWRKNAKNYAWNESVGSAWPRKNHWLTYLKRIRPQKITRCRCLYRLWLAFLLRYYWNNDLVNWFIFRFKFAQKRKQTVLFVWFASLILEMTF